MNNFEFVEFGLQKYENHMNRFYLKNDFCKIYIYYFLINIFIKIIIQSHILESVSLSKMILFF